MIPYPDPIKEIAKHDPRSPMAMVLVTYGIKEDRRLKKKALMFHLSKMIQAIASEITNAIGTTANAKPKLCISLAP